jgi:hypothetical protein
MTDREIIQLLVDALQAMLAGGNPEGQAQVKVDQAQAALLEDDE